MHPMSSKAYTLVSILDHLEGYAYYAHICPRSGIYVMPTRCMSLEPCLASAYSQQAVRSGA